MAPPENPPQNPPSEKNGPPPASFPAPPPRREAMVPRHPNRLMLSALCIAVSIYAIVKVDFVTDRKWVHSVTAQVCGGFMGWAFVMLWMDKAVEDPGPQGVNEKRVMRPDEDVEGRGLGRTGAEVPGTQEGQCRYCHRASQTERV